MFRRHRNQPPHPHTSPDNKYSEQPALIRQQILSPQQIFTRIERKPAD